MSDRRCGYDCQRQRSGKLATSRGLSSLAASNLCWVLREAKSGRVWAPFHLVCHSNCGYATKFSPSIRGNERLPNLRQDFVLTRWLGLPPVTSKRPSPRVLSDMDAEIAALEARRDKTARNQAGHDAAAPHRPGAAGERPRL